MRFQIIYRMSLFLLLAMQSVAAFSRHAGYKPTETGDTTANAASARQGFPIRPVNIISLNILGDATIASLNYERLFPAEPEHFFLAAGLGVGVNTFVTLHSEAGKSYTLDNFAVIPHHITGNIGGGRHFFELGLGGAIIGSQGGQPYLTSILMGYRFLPLHSNRISARLYASYPLQGLEKFNIIYVPAGVSVGWAF